MDELALRRMLSDALRAPAKPGDLAGLGIRVELAHGSRTPFTYWLACPYQPPEWRES